MRLKYFSFLLFFFSLASTLSAIRETPLGPLRISADETISKNSGREFEAKGNVWIAYELESKDVLESYSDFARFNETTKCGELLGDPRAVWKRNNPPQPSITLKADRILFEIPNEELSAYGNVFVYQANSTLNANEVHFSNLEKKLSASGGRPEFHITAPEHKTEISANEIQAWTDKKTIHFTGKVSGVVLLTEAQP